MKFDRIIWGVILLFIGGVLLLSNFNVIDFYWRNVWDFWPLILIIFGVNILFNRNNSQTGNVISLGILVIALSFLFVKGQQRPEGNWFRNNISHDIDVNINDDNDNDTVSGVAKNTYTEQFLDTYADKKTILNLSGGGTSFELKGTGDSLFTANVHERRNNYTFTKDFTDSVHTLNFKMRNRGKDKWNFGNNNGVDIYLNSNPVWFINLKMGAGETNFDLSQFKVRTLNFDGGAAELEVKLSDLLPITDVNVKTGVADVKISVPTASGCRIKTKTGLSSKDFTGFTKVSSDLYESPNFESATNKVFINFDGGLSSFEVKRY